MLSNISTVEKSDGTFLQSAVLYVENGKGNLKLFFSVFISRKRLIVPKKPNVLSQKYKFKFISLLFPVFYFLDLFTWEYF